MWCAKTLKAYRKKKTDKVVKCGECGKTFKYFSFSNTIRKFCKACAKARTKESKKRHLEKEKLETGFDPEEDRIRQAKAAVKPYPISYIKLIDMCGNEC